MAKYGREKVWGTEVPSAGDFNREFDLVSRSINQIDGPQIPDDAIGTSKIVDNAVTSYHIPENEIATADLADQIVTADKMGPGFTRVWQFTKHKNFDFYTMPTFFFFNGEQLTANWSDYDHGYNIQRVWGNWSQDLLEFQIISDDDPGYLKIDVTCLLWYSIKDYDQDSFDYWILSLWRDGVIRTTHKAGMTVIKKPLNENYMNQQCRLSDTLVRMDPVTTYNYTFRIHQGETSTPSVPNNEAGGISDVIVTVTEMKR